MQSDNFAEVRIALKGVLNGLEVSLKGLQFQQAQVEMSKAEDLYEKLHSIANPNNTVQQTVLQNRMRRMTTLQTRIEDGLRRREEGKREDGNLAFKCNWNDMGYKGVCSDQAYQHNIRWGRPWCSSAKCREYVGVDPVPLDCCYESRALIDCSFGAGWDLEGSDMARPRRIWSARKGKIALLTTVRPESHQRILVGAYIIRDVVDDPGKETWVFGEENCAIDDMLDYEISFWMYHKNPGNPSSTAWATGLFRYVSNVAVLGILEEYIGKKSHNGGSTAPAEKMVAALRQGVSRDV